MGGGKATNSQNPSPFHTSSSKGIPPPKTAPPTWDQGFKYVNLYTGAFLFQILGTEETRKLWEAEPLTRQCLHCAEWIEV